MYFCNLIYSRLTSKRFGWIFASLELVSSLHFAEGCLKSTFEAGFNSSTADSVILQVFFKRKTAHHYPFVLSSLFQWTLEEKLRCYIIKMQESALSHLLKLQFVSVCEKIKSSTHMNVHLWKWFWRNYFDLYYKQGHIIFPRFG